MVNLPVEYSDKQVTPFGGMSLMKRFIDQTGIRDYLDELNLPQPQSNRGYCPKHMIESFWLGIWTGASRYIHCDWSWLRPGNTADSSSCKEFMEETFTEVLKDKKIGLVRADSGFYTEELMSFLERKRLNYLMAVRMYPNVKNTIGGLQEWVELSKGIELNQMQFKHENGKFRRYVIVRKQVDIRPKAAGKMLFEDRPGYRYSCYVTNLDLPLDPVWNIYNTRADCENRIKELKEDFGLDNFCLKDFWATEASFRFIMVAYNLMSLFRHFAINQHNRARLKTLKLYGFALGAWTVNHANRKTLKIALPTKKRPWMDGLFSQIKNLSPPFVYSIA